MGAHSHAQRAVPVRLSRVPRALPNSPLRHRQVSSRCPWFAGAHCSIDVHRSVPPVRNRQNVFWEYVNADLDGDGFIDRCVRASAIDSSAWWLLCSQSGCLQGAHEWQRRVHCVWPRRQHGRTHQRAGTASLLLLELALKWCGCAVLVPLVASHLAIVRRVQSNVSARTRGLDSTQGAEGSRSVSCHCTQARARVAAGDRHRGPVLHLGVEPARAALAADGQGRRVGEEVVGGLTPRTCARLSCQLISHKFCWNHDTWCSHTVIHTLQN